MGSQLSAIRQVYDRLWEEAVQAFAREELEFDPHLPEKGRDLRRGLTLAFRPSRTVQASIDAFLDKLKEVGPSQYFYRPEEFHVTVLAIIPGSARWQDQIHHLPEYQACAKTVLSRQRSFSVEFRGVTASRGAVMIQGFPGDDTLSNIREELREELRRRKLGQLLDFRYKIISAHMTAMRFCDARADWQSLLALLEENRTTRFGETRVTSLELILGDWYASANTVRTIEKYSL